jgi:N6-adenosine-specific RNA methylase IME4
VTDKQLRIIDGATGELITAGMDFTKTSLTIDPETQYERWESIGEQLNQIEGAIQWWIGDWLNFGEHKYGELYAQAIDAGADPKTWMDYKWVSNAIETSFRNDVLSWSHHRAVAPLSPNEQKYWLDKAAKEGLNKNDLRHAIKIKKFQDKVGELPDDKYRVIYADPPWEYATPQHSREEQKTTLDSHYPSLPLNKICDLPVGELAQEDAVLFLWATSPLILDAFQVIEAWGFTYKASFIWDKVKHNVGHYNSVRHEFLFIATKGSCLPDKKPDGEPVLIDSVQSIERTEHSAKPQEFRNIIDQLYPAGKRIELFARSAYPGWDTWGNEV